MAAIPDTGDGGSEARRRERVPAPRMGGAGARRSLSEPPRLWTPADRLTERVAQAMSGRGTEPGRGRLERAMPPLRNRPQQIRGSSPTHRRRSGPGHSIDKEDR
ncbi:MAG: hypothetical protein JST59_29040 [Actinobacteria bacterium]|nr:hypothetical protein [Actinomycetota bacterium]